jgi:hypothetical protein
VGSSLSSRAVQFGYSSPRSENSILSVSNYLSESPSKQSPCTGSLYLFIGQHKVAFERMFKLNNTGCEDRQAYGGLLCAELQGTDRTLHVRSVLDIT